MKLITLIMSAAIFMLGLASGIFAAFLYIVTVAGCFALIVASDYGRRPSSDSARRDLTRRERLPLAV